MHSLDTTASRINVINQLLKLESATNFKEPFFKRTAAAFKKKYGFDLVGAPIIFKAQGFIYKLSFIQGNYSKNLGGRKWERAEYLPIVEVGDKFSRLELNENN